MIGEVGGFECRFGTQLAEILPGMHLGNARWEIYQGAAMNRTVWPYFTLVCGIFLSVVSILEIFVFDKITLSDIGSAYFLGFAFLISASITIYWRARNFFVSDRMFVVIVAIGLPIVLTIKLFDLELVAYWMRVTVSLTTLFYGLFRSSQLYADGTV